MKNISLSRSLSFLTLIILVLLSAGGGGCQADIYATEISTLRPTEVLTEPTDSPLVLPDTVPELIEVLLGDFADNARIGAARKLGGFGPIASPAIPALAISLCNDRDPSELHEMAAWALGEIGPNSKLAIPILVTVLLHSDAANVRRAAAEALGKIGDKSVLFSLSIALNDVESVVSVRAAESMGILAGQQFPDMGSNSYHTDVDGSLLIVNSAKTWWIEDGQFRNWLLP
jgi:HEAT repeat protein